MRKTILKLLLKLLADNIPVIYKGTAKEGDYIISVNTKDNPIVIDLIICK